nr:MAG TPA: hypothetical protein [Caudoviricetes sp.]
MVSDKIKAARPISINEIGLTASIYYRWVRFH